MVHLVKQKKSKFARSLYELVMVSFEGRKVLLDTNLLLLLLIGSINRRLLTTNKRVGRYSENEFLLLNRHLSDAASLLTTQHINSQTSDLGAGSLHGIYRTMFLRLLRNIHVHDVGAISTIKADEMTQPILSFDTDILDELGVADAGLINAAIESKGILFTDDLPLYLRAQRHGIDAVNFSHLLT